MEVKKLKAVNYRAVKKTTCCSLQETISLHNVAISHKEMLVIMLNKDDTIDML